MFLSTAWASCPATASTFKHSNSAPKAALYVSVRTPHWLPMYSDYHPNPGASVDVPHGYGNVDDGYRLQTNEHGDAELPDGWVQYQSDDGWPYYYNAELNISSWEHPGINFPTGQPSSAADNAVDETSTSLYVSDPSQTAEHERSSEYEEYWNYSLSADSQVQQMASVTLQLNMATISSSTAHRETESGAISRTPYTASSAVSAVTAEEFFSPFTPASSGVSVEGMDRFSVGSESPLAGLSGLGTDMQQGERAAEAEDQLPESDENLYESGHSLALSGSLQLSSPSLMADLSTAENRDRSDSITQHDEGHVEEPVGGESQQSAPIIATPTAQAGTDNQVQERAREPEYLASEREAAQQRSGEAHQRLALSVDDHPPQQLRQSPSEVPLELSPASVPSGVFPFAAPQSHLQPQSHAASVDSGDSYPYPYLYPHSSPQPSAHLPPRGLGSSPRDAHLPDRHHLSYPQHRGGSHPLVSPTTPSSGESELFQCLSSSIDGDGGTPSIASASQSLSQSHSHMGGEGDSGLSSVASALVAAAQIAPIPEAEEEVEADVDADVTADTDIDVNAEAEAEVEVMAEVETEAVGEGEVHGEEAAASGDQGSPAGMDMEQPLAPAVAWEWERHSSHHDLVEQFPPPPLPPPPSILPVAQTPPGAYSPILFSEEDASGIETPGRPVFYSPTTSQAADVAALISDDSDEDAHMEEQASRTRQQEWDPNAAAASHPAADQDGWGNDHGTSSSYDPEGYWTEALTDQYSHLSPDVAEGQQSFQGNGPAWGAYESQGAAAAGDELPQSAGGMAAGGETLDRRNAYESNDYDWQDTVPYAYEQQKQQPQQQWSAQDGAEGREGHGAEGGGGGGGGPTGSTGWEGQVPAPSAEEAQQGSAGVLSAHEVAWLQYEQLRDSGTMAVSEAVQLGTLDHQQQPQLELFMTATMQASSQGTNPTTSKYGRLRAALQHGKGRGIDVGNRGAMGPATVSGGPSQSQYQHHEEDEFYEAQPGTAATGTTQSARWQQCVTAQGDVYYYNLDTQHVQWENPHEEASSTAAAYQDPGQTQVDPQQHTNSQQQDQQDQQQGSQEAWPATWSDPQPTVSFGAGSPSEGGGERGVQTVFSGQQDAGSTEKATSAAASAPVPVVAPRKGMVTRNSVAASATSAASLLQETQGYGAGPSQASSSGGTPAASVASARSGLAQHSASARASGPSWSVPPVIDSRHPATGIDGQGHEQPFYEPDASYPASGFGSYAMAGPHGMYPAGNAQPTPVEEPGAESEEDGEGDRSTVGSPAEMGTYGRHAPFGNRASTRSISSLSDNESSEYGYGRSIQGSVQGAFVLGAAHHPYVSGVWAGRPSPYGAAAPYTPDSPAQPSGGAFALSPGSGDREGGWEGSFSPAAGPVDGRDTGGDAASQASTESQKQRHLEIWDRFFRNAMLISQRTEGYADEAQLPRNAVSESIRKIRQKAAMSRSKGATAVARWPHPLPQRRYAALVRLALRKGCATESHVSDADVSDLNAEERAVVESGSVAGSVSSIDGTLLSMALLAASLHEDLGAAQRLLQSGANPSCVDDQLRTPAHYCAKSGQADLLALLCDHDADLEATDAAGRSPLHTAAIFGRTAVMEFLVGCAVDCNAADLAGNTPLHLAARAGFAEGCSLLLRFGASVGSRNLMGMTAQGVAQVMRPQTAALQEVVAVLSSPPSAGSADRTGFATAGLASNQNQKHGPYGEVDGRDHQSHTSSRDKQPLTGSGTGSRKEETAPVPSSNQAGRVTNATGPDSGTSLRDGKGRHGTAPDRVEGGRGEGDRQETHEVAEDGEDEAEQEAEEEGEGEEGEEEDEGGSVADVVASSVWGVAATLIDITLSMFSGPSGSGGGGRGAKGEVSSREKRGGWGLFSAPDRDGLTSKSDEGASSTGSLQGLAGGPPTDKELRERGLGFPVIPGPAAASVGGGPASKPPLVPPSVGKAFAPPPAIVAREIDRQVEALRSSAASTPSRGGDSGSPRYVPPTPPSEVMVAVALSRAEQQRQQQQQAAARPAPSLSLMDDTDDTADPYAPSMPHRLRPASHTHPAGALRFHAPQGGYLVPPEALPPNAEDSPSPTPEEPVSPPTSGNGYSLGNALPKGVTWRYVDVLSNQK